VATCVYNKYIESKLNGLADNSRTVIVSTASPYKFDTSVLTALGTDSTLKDDYEQAKLLREISGIEIPDAVEEIHYAPIMHDNVCDINEMMLKVEEILKII
jgi:threonine synthase